MRVLFVCTANICRSPMAAGLFVHAAKERGISDAFTASAGFLEGGQRSHEHVVSILAPKGIDMSRKLSQKLSGELVDGSDLVLAMTSEHARGVVARFPESIKKVYTFRHFGSIVSPRTTSESTQDWLAHISASTKRVYLGDDEILDIPDPIGQGPDIFVGLANELANTLGWMLDCAYPAQVRTG